MTTSTDYDTDDESLSRWGRIFWENYEELAKSIKAVSNSSSTSLVPATTASKAIQIAERDVKHAALLLASKDHEIEEEWKLPVATVTTQYLDDNGRTVSSSYQLSLKDMANWSPKPVKIETEQPGRGYTTKSTNVEGHIPPIAAKQLFGQLTRVVEEIGWLPDAKSGTPRTELDENLIEEVEQWRKQTLED